MYILYEINVNKSEKWLTLLTLHAVNIEKYNSDLISCFIFHGAWVVNNNLNDSCTT